MNTRQASVLASMTGLLLVKSQKTPVPSWYACSWSASKGAEIYAGEFAPLPPIVLHQWLKLLEILSRLGDAKSSPPLIIVPLGAIAGAGPGVKNAMYSSCGSYPKV